MNEIFTRKIYIKNHKKEFNLNTASLRHFLLIFSNDLPWSGLSCISLSIFRKHLVFSFFIRLLFPLSYLTYGVSTELSLTNKVNVLFLADMNAGKRFFEGMTFVLTSANRRIRPGTESSGKTFAVTSNKHPIFL